MRITLYGAGLEVTGSCFQIQTDSSTILVDCGVFQGSKKLERENVIPRSLDVRALKAVILTHGHLDHCGRLPLLMKLGFHGVIYATAGTIDVAKLILTDAARVQKEDTMRENRRRERYKLKPLQPLYTAAEVERVFPRFRAVNLQEPTRITDDLQFTLIEAGHILGSSCVKLEVTEPDGKVKTVVFSGDIGPRNAPIMRDPESIPFADAIFMESTYGDRDHRPLSETVAEFELLIKRGVELGGKILIPTFAIGRSQQMLYYLAELFRTGKVKRIPVYLDSPMAIAATELYMKHQELMDTDAGVFGHGGKLERALPELHYCLTADESRALNDVEGPCVILAGSGMCDAGRILHHLRRNLNSEQTAVLIVGYQARGSLGRLLLDGKSPIRILGETVPVRATVRGLGGFSAHAGQSDLLNWLEPMAAHRPKVFLVHGEPHPMSELTHQIRLKYAISAISPRIKETVVV